MQSGELFVGNITRSHAVRGNEKKLKPGHILINAEEKNKSSPMTKDFRRQQFINLVWTQLVVRPKDLKEHRFKQLFKQRKTGQIQYPVTNLSYLYVTNAIL